jgi:hypothetical protein
MVSSEYKALLLALVFTVGFSVQAENADSCQQRSVIVNPRQEGKLVSGLQASSFRGSLQGRSVKVLSAKVNTEAPRIVLLLDLSGSVNRNNHKLDTEQFLAENIVTTSFIPHLALVLFSDRLLDSVGFDHAPKAIEQRLANLKDGQGPTALFDSLAYSAGIFHTREPGDAIYVITDGGENHSSSHAKDVEKELLSKGIRLFVFLVSAIKPPLVSEEEQQGYSDLQRLAEVTGGSIVNAEYNPYEKERRELEARCNAATTR